MSQPIYNVEDFEERLSELTIGTEDVQKLMDFVHMQERRLKFQSKKIDIAANMLGHNLIDECLIEMDYE
jgi:hypothetical protein